jgi:hypothetical protein
MTTMIALPAGRPHSCACAAGSAMPSAIAAVSMSDTARHNINASTRHQPRRFVAARIRRILA